jgi:hypothetical protein
MDGSNREIASTCFPDTVIFSISITIKVFAKSNTVATDVPDNGNAILITPALLIVVLHRTAFTLYLANSVHKPLKEGIKESIVADFHCSTGKTPSDDANTCWIVGMHDTSSTPLCCIAETNLVILCRINETSVCLTLTFVTYQDIFKKARIGIIIENTHFCCQHTAAGEHIKRDTTKRVTSPPG